MPVPPIKHFFYGNDYFSQECSQLMDILSSPPFYIVCFIESRWYLTDPGPEVPLDDVKKLASQLNELLALAPNPSEKYGPTSTCKAYLFLAVSHFFLGRYELAGEYAQACADFNAVQGRYENEKDASFEYLIAGFAFERAGDSQRALACFEALQTKYGGHWIHLGEGEDEFYSDMLAAMKRVEAAQPAEMLDVVDVMQVEAASGEPVFAGPLNQEPVNITGHSHPRGNEEQDVGPDARRQRPLDRNETQPDITGLPRCREDDQIDGSQNLFHRARQ